MRISEYFRYLQGGGILPTRAARVHEDSRAAREQYRRSRDLLLDFLDDDVVLGRTVTPRERMTIAARAMRCAERDIARVDHVFADVSGRYLDAMCRHDPRSASVRVFIGPAIRIARESYEPDSALVLDLYSIRERAWSNLPLRRRLRRSNTEGKIDRYRTQSTVLREDLRNNVDALVRTTSDLAYAYLGAGRYANAIETFDEVAALLRDEDYSRKFIYFSSFELADELYQLGEIDRAVELLEPLSRHEPGGHRDSLALEPHELICATRVQLFLGSGYLASEQPHKAEAVFRKSLERLDLYRDERSNPEVYALQHRLVYESAAALLDQRKHEEAIERFRRAHHLVEGPVRMDLSAEQVYYDAIVYSRIMYDLARGRPV